MTELQLEVGKTYVDRRGDHHRIVKVNAGGGVFEDHEQRSYNRDGSCVYLWLGAEVFNLVAEANAEGGAAHEPKPAVPHADLIRAVLDGKVVQIEGVEPWSAGGPKWVEYSGQAAVGVLLASSGRLARLKPERLVCWCPVTDAGVWGSYSARRDVPKFMSGDSKVVKVLRLELDPDTLEVIDARTEAP